MKDIETETDEFLESNKKEAQKGTGKWTPPQHTGPSTGVSATAQPTNPDGATKPPQQGIAPPEDAVPGTAIPAEAPEISDGVSVGGSGKDEFLPSSETPKNKPVGWGNDKPKNTPDMPDEMPGPTEWEVTEDQTVAGQMEKLMASDSPLLNQIKDQTALNAAKSGLKNTLMALNAGEMNAINTAFSVAQQDAQTYARSAEFNALTKNQFSAAEQAFMHSAMLSDQNFKQAKKLQREQIDGALQQIAAEVEGREDLANLGQEHWLQQSGVMHAQNLESMEMNHVLDVERLGVVQDYSLEAMAFQTENEMILNDQQAGNQAALMDRQLMQNLQQNEQQFGHQMAYNYQQATFGMLNTELAMLGQIGSADLTPEQMRAASRQVSDKTTKNLEFGAAFFNANAGPAVQAGIGGDPRLDYLSYGDSGVPAGGPEQSPSATPGSGTEYGYSGSAGGSVTPPSDGSVT